MNSNDKSTGEKSYCPELEQHGNSDDILTIRLVGETGLHLPNNGKLSFAHSKTMEYGITDTISSIPIFP